jgi:hypothetical protein
MNPEEKNLMTSPDTDQGDHFQLLLVDFHWNEIAGIADMINRLPGRITVYTHGNQDTDHAWCLQVSRLATCTLINMQEHNMELIKGILMPRSNSWCYGPHKLDSIYTNKVIDIYAWLALQYKQYHQEEKNGI